MDEHNLSVARMAKQKKKRQNKTKNKQKDHSIKLRAYSISSTKELKKEVLVGVRCQKKNFP